MSYKLHTINKAIWLTIMLTINFSYTQAQEKEPVKNKPIKVSDYEATDENNYKQKLNTIDTSERGKETTSSEPNTANYSRSSSSSSDGNDIGTPSNSPFQLGGDIQGNIKNSVSQVTGKVAFSVPLASIQAGTSGYAVNLSYDGQSGFQIGKEQNKYSPTSTVGVGWSLPVPKIVVNNKQTAAQDDDEFFLFDGSTNTKLICINKDENVWEFQMEKYAPWIIKYHKGFTEFVQNPVTGIFETIFRESDYWTIIKDDGKTYYYGYATRLQNNSEPNSSSKSKENVVAWGNWIGDSRKPYGVKKTIVWNISRIKDQWGKKLDFTYELQEVNQSGSIKQTEAAYIKKITSSNGASIQLNYGFKDISEYYEPHTEINEPDAYQERYEKKYLNNIKVYNNSNSIVSTYNLGYTLNGSGANKKRYLTEISQISHKDGQSYTLPPQQFEYYLSSTFKGGLKKVIYPSGGSVVYNYENKYTFYNGANKYETTPNWPSGYVFYAALVKDNYHLYVRRSTNPISGSKYRFKIFRYWWNGQQWESDEFTFPHLMEDTSTERMKNFYSVFQDDFYGFAFDKGSTADIYLWHKEKNGNTWKYYPHSNLNIADENPRLMSGTNFVALGSHRAGRLYTYAWNGTTWNFKQINQGSGQYYYGATNNFILSLDEDGGTDMITGNGHEDNYYIHYLDIEKKWQTKSWSAKADPYIAGIEKPSYFYPANAMAGFVADDNPELFLRWDNEYNLKYVDNVLGAYNDNNPIQPVGNDLFTLHNWFYGMPYKSARFNGLNWKVASLPSSSSYYAKLNFGEDMMTFQDHNSFNGVGYHMYDPNSDNFSYSSLNNTGLIPNSKGNGISREFTIAGNKIYKKSTQGVPTILFQQIGGLQYSNDFTYTDGLSHAFVKESQYSGSSITFQQGSYFYINKENGLLNKISLNQYHLSGFAKFGGYTPFMSPKSIWLRSESTYNPNTGTSSFTPYVYRIIEDKFNQSVYNIVVSNIELDDANGGVRKIQYTYNNPQPSPDNSVVYYGEVLTENKGFGSSSLGKIKRIFNTGDIDQNMVGLTLEEHVLDVNNFLKRKVTNTWQKHLKTAHNGSYQVDLSHYIALKNKKEELFFNNDKITTITNNYYNSKGQLSTTNTTNSKGQVERQDIRYAHEQYSFVRDKNMLTDVYETKTKLNNEVVNVDRVNWINSSGKVYINENWSGPDLNNLRLNSKITNVNAFGNILENHNGKENYNTVLTGYNNLHEVATIVNSRYQDVINELDVSFSQLQNLNTSALKVELMKLYDRLPNAMIGLTFYDENGRVINRVNERKEESFIYYDPYGRVDYITDGYGKVIEKKEYNFGN